MLDTSEALNLQAGLEASSVRFRKCGDFSDHADTAPVSPSTAEIDGMAKGDRGRKRVRRGTLASACSGAH